MIANSTAILFLVCTSDHVFGYTCLDFVQINHYGVLPNGKDEIVNSDNIGIKNLLNEMVQTNASTCIDEMDQDQANIFSDTIEMDWVSLGVMKPQMCITLEKKMLSKIVFGCQLSTAGVLRAVCVHCLAIHCLLRQGTGQVTLI